MFIFFKLDQLQQKKKWKVIDTKKFGMELNNLSKKFLSLEKKIQNIIKVQCWV